jgi:hypothetical protein
MRPARQVVTRSPHRSVGVVAAPWLQPEPIQYESQLELRFINIALACPVVTNVWSQPFRLDYELDGKLSSYTPDFLVVVEGGARVVVEVKPKIFLEEWHARLDAIDRRLQAQGCSYRVLTDQQLTPVRADMARIWRRYANEEPGEDLVRRALALAATPSAVSFAQLLEAGFALNSIYHLLIRRRLWSRDGLALTSETRLHCPQVLEPRHVCLFFDDWFGGAPWRAQLAP